MSVKRLSFEQAHAFMSGIIGMNQVIPSFAVCSFILPHYCDCIHTRVLNMSICLTTTVEI